MLTAKRLDEIEKRQAAATGGAWAVSPQSSHQVIADARSHLTRQVVIVETTTPTNALFIAHARQDIPDMGRAIEEAYDLLDRMAQDQTALHLGMEMGQQEERKILHALVEKHAYAWRQQRNSVVTASEALNAILWALPVTTSPVTPLLDIIRKQEREKGAEDMKADMLGALKDYESNAGESEGIKLVIRLIESLQRKS